MADQVRYVNHEYTWCHTLFHTEIKNVSKVNRSRVYNAIPVSKIVPGPMTQRNGASSNGSDSRAESGSQSKKRSRPEDEESTQATASKGPKFSEIINQDSQVNQQSVAPPLPTEKQRLPVPDPPPTAAENDQHGSSDRRQPQSLSPELKEHHKTILKQKLARQFADEKATYRERKSLLGNYLNPPMYAYTQTAGNFKKWEHKVSDEGKNKVWKETALVSKEELPKRISESKHFERILKITENRLLTPCEPTSTNALYYVILNLPGVDKEHNDQGYIGKVTKKHKISGRWRLHDGHSLIDQNLDLLQNYCEATDEELLDYAAIFLLGLAAESSTVDKLESFYMCREFCTKHGTLAVKCKRHKEICNCECQKQDSSSDKDCVADCNEKVCQDKTCKAQCIRLTDMRYGMNYYDQGTISSAQNFQTTDIYFGDGKELCYIKAE